MPPSAQLLHTLFEVTQGHGRRARNFTVLLQNIVEHPLLTPKSFVVPLFVNVAADALAVAHPIYNVCNLQARAAHELHAAQLRYDRGGGERCVGISACDCDDDVARHCSSASIVPVYLTRSRTRAESRYESPCSSKCMTGRGGGDVQGYLAINGFRSTGKNNTG